MAEFANPFKPGAGHQPPYLAGRESEQDEFLKLLSQETILVNVVLTGLRGVGKTVLLDSLKPMAIRDGWMWAGADLSESTSVSEESIAVRICTDLAVVTSDVVLSTDQARRVGFRGERTERRRTLDFDTLSSVYDETPGLSSDKLKAVLETTWTALSGRQNLKGIIFAYDEAQNLSDQASKDQYPVSLLLDVFQSIQKKDLPLMLVLTGLPTLFPKLVEARTFAERMFRVVSLGSLTPKESRDAILKPMEDARCPVRLNEASVRKIIQMSGGYPYFIQFICREVYDALLHRVDRGESAKVPVHEIERKLDTDFFAGRWARATDRQRELMSVIAQLPNADEEFSVQVIVDLSKKKLDKPFSNSHVSQMLTALSEQGLVFKNRHGRYTFAVPLMGRFIKRQMSAGASAS